MSKRLLGDLELNRIYQRDCLEGMKLIPDKSIDMILCDLPYGTTACKWDTVIPFEPLWEQYERIIKDNGAIVLTASQPFTSALVMSNPKIFKYSLVWEKSQSTGHLNCKIMPMRKHEDILVFGKNRIKYFPQMQKKPKENIRPQVNGKENLGDGSSAYGSFSRKTTRQIPFDMSYPQSVLKINNPNHGEKGLHPTQKPIALFEYLIKTYSTEGDIVLDNCMGSGTTAIAALRTGRHFIGFETEPAYVEIANKRIDNELEAN